MMKNLATNKLLLLWGALTLTLAVSWVLAQSNTPITIGTNRFTAIQHIKEVHLNQKKEGKVSKVWLMNTWGTTLGIASVVLGQWGKVDKMEKLNNTTDENSSIIAGVGNKNTAGEWSFLVGGKNNTASTGGQQKDTNNAVIFWGSENKNQAPNGVILSSTKATLGTEASGAVAVAATNVIINAENSAAYGGSNVKIQPGASESFVLGSNVEIASWGIFAFNVKPETLTWKKQWTFLVNADYGMIVGTNDAKSKDIQLTIGGALRVGAWSETDPSNFPEGTIFRRACQGNTLSCLCMKWSDGLKSVSNNTLCNDVCKNWANACKWAAKCWDKARKYEKAETTRRPISQFCGEGSALTGTAPGFPMSWGPKVTWTCVSPSGGNPVTCEASRK